MDWEKVRTTLKNNKWDCFMAASLCIGSFSMTIDGRGFDVKDMQSYDLPEDITDLVDAIYLREKGETKYYKETSRIYKLRIPQIQGV